MVVLRDVCFAETLSEPLGRVLETNRITLRTGLPSASSEWDTIVSDRAVRDAHSLMESELCDGGPAEPTLGVGEGAEGTLTLVRTASAAGRRAEPSLSLSSPSPSGLFFFRTCLCFSSARAYCQRVP